MALLNRFDNRYQSAADAFFRELSWKQMYFLNVIIMLLLDPLYLSVLCSFFGGGDMNGISLLVPELAARIGFGVLLLVNGFVFWKAVLPKYTAAFKQ